MTESISGMGTPHSDALWTQHIDHGAATPAPPFFQFEPIIYFARKTSTFRSGMQSADSEAVLC